MGLVTRRNQPWVRKHDRTGSAAVQSAPITVFPRTLEEVIEICRTREPQQRIHAAGSHWALSEAAQSDHVFVETNDPAEVEQALGRQLFDVVPPCLNPGFVDELLRTEVPPFDRNTVGGRRVIYPVHVEAGKRIFQIYAELDFGDRDARSLATLLRDRGNPGYLGSWAFRTLGGAGGQTIAGAFSTGTHGGDFTLPPIADDILALHLVADGGKHYWIEPREIRFLELPLTIDEPLRAFYGQERFGGTGNFEIIRDDEMFRAALVSVGRFGIIYSVVLAAVPQYSLHQERRLTLWQDVRGLIADFNSPLYVGNDQPPEQQPPAPNRFLQIGISVTPHAGGTRNLAGVTKRWNVPLAPRPDSDEPAGRRERRGDIIQPFRPRIQAPLFRNAGLSFSYTPDPERPGLAEGPSFLEKACSDSNFIDGVVTEVFNEIDDFVRSNGFEIGVLLTAVTIVGGGVVVIALIAAFVAILAVLRLLQAQLRGSNMRFGQTLNHIRRALLEREDADERRAGMVVWQMIVFRVFSDQQEDVDFEAISYAVMDAHNYRDRSCEANVDSIEVFFDAADPMLIAYVDALLAFEQTQEAELGRAFAGYISLRFTGSTRALLGEQQFQRTCAVEVSGLRDVSGVTELIDFAIETALDPNFLGILHWGQRNGARRAQIEDRFGDAPDNPLGPLNRWRQALSRITQNGRLDGFSSAFTRRTGLEIVRPNIDSLVAKGATIGAPITVEWDCAQNPPGTEIALQIVAPDGRRASFDKLPLAGQRLLPTERIGLHGITLTAAIELEGERVETVSVAIADVTPIPGPA